MAEEDRCDNYKVRSKGGGCRHKTVIPNKIMIIKMAHDTRNWSGKGGVWMVRNSGGDKAKMSRVMKQNYMKVTDGNRKGTPVRTKWELNMVQPVRITRKAIILGYVLSKNLVSLLSIPVDSMDMLCYSEIPKNKKGGSSISLPPVTRCESLSG